MKTISYIVSIAIISLYCCTKKDNAEPIFLINNKNSNCKIDSSIIEKEKKCSMGDYDLCVDAANDYIEDRVGIGDYRKGYSLLETACNGGASLGCYELALLYQGEMGILQKDVLKSEYYFKRSCDFGDKDACEWLRKNSQKK